MPEFYMIHVRKISKIPEFLMIFARKNYKIPEFYMIFARILHNNCPKNIFPEVWEHVRTLMPPPRLICLCFGQIGMAATRGNGYVYLTCWDPERGGGYCRTRWSSVGSTSCQARCAQRHYCYFHPY